MGPRIWRYRYADGKLFVVDGLSNQVVLGKNELQRINSFSSSSFFFPLKELIQFFKNTEKLKIAVATKIKIYFIGTDLFS